MRSTTPMSRREFIAAAGGASRLAANALSTKVLAAGDATSAVALPLRLRGGVSLAGAEFGSERADFSNQNPGIYGRDYQYPQRQTIEYFAAHGLGLLRLPFRWECLQPRLFAPLAYPELARMREVVRRDGASGAAIVLDLHNYGRYRLVSGARARTVTIDEQLDGQVPVPRTAFADFWRRLAGEFANDSTVVGLGLMNEPHDMGSSDWKQISQAAVDAVREVNQDAHVVVAGDSWSSAERFEEVNGPRAWVRDAAHRVVYEAHCYFDADGSGKYRRSYAAELRNDPRLVIRGAARLRVFFEWCARNRVAGFVGEFGIPGDDAGWQGVMAGALEEIRHRGVSACYWAAGEWWHDYPLSIQPRNDMRDPAPQQTLLAKFLAERTSSRRQF